MVLEVVDSILLVLWVSWLVILLFFSTHPSEWNVSMTVFLLRSFCYLLSATLAYQALDALTGGDSK
jgi:hypothetical protein